MKLDDELVMLEDCPFLLLNFSDFEYFINHFPVLRYFHDYEFNQMEDQEIIKMKFTLIEELDHIDDDTF